MGTWDKGERSMKNTIDLYLQFREELDKMCVPEILNVVETTKIMHDGEVVGILCTQQDYIDCLYIMPEYRKKGLGKKAVTEWWKNKAYKHDVRLHIINVNKPALRFWNKVFELELIEKNAIDGLYRIRRLK